MAIYLRDIVYTTHRCHQACFCFVFLLCKHLHVAQVTADLQTKSERVGKKASDEVMEVLEMQRTASKSLRAKTADGWITVETNDGKKLAEIDEVAEPQPPAPQPQQQPGAHAQPLNSSQLMRTETLTLDDGSRPTTFTVTVPEGVVAGENIEVTSPRGVLLLVQVPNGTQTGDEIEVADTTEPEPLQLTGGAEASNLSRGSERTSVRLQNSSAAAAAANAKEPEPEEEFEPEPQPDPGVSQAIRAKRGELMGADQELLRREMTFLNSEPGKHPNSGKSWFKIRGEVKPLIDEDTDESRAEAINIIADAWVYSGQGKGGHQVTDYGLERGQEKAMMAQGTTAWQRNSGSSATQDVPANYATKEEYARRKKEEYALSRRKN